MTLTVASVLQRYTQAGIDFSDLAWSIEEDQYNTVTGADSWPAAYVIHHMADADIHFASRYLLIIEGAKPHFQMFNEDVYPERLNYAGRSAVSSLAAFEGIHESIEDILSNLPDEAWERTGTHPERGELTLLQVLDGACGHLEAHVAQLSAIAKELQ